MKDAQNLSKLLGHLPPKIFRTFVHEEFNTTLPELNEKDQGNRMNIPHLCDGYCVFPLYPLQHLPPSA